MVTCSSISRLENSMDRGAWRATVYGATELDMIEHTLIVGMHLCSQQENPQTTPTQVATTTSTHTIIHESVQTQWK